MKIMVMAGTSDAAELIKQLKNRDKDIQVTATTVTDYGAEIARTVGADQIIAQPLPQDELTTIIKERKINVLADATHPFAAEATRNAIKATKKAGINYFRLERPLTVLPDSPLIHPASDFWEAAQMAKKITEGRVLHLAGVATLHQLTRVIKPDRMVARVLSSAYSVKKCHKLGLSGENIIAMQGTFSKEFNRALMREYGAELVVTKDSGQSGGTPSKIEAALELGIPVIMVRRPPVPELDKEKVFTSVDELVDEILRDI